jgi:glycosyltransferase involved in cell wall biosynthesis
MPAYNEEGAIADAVNEVRVWVLDRVEGSELVVVDDGSTDATGRILDELAADGRIRVIHRANRGHGPALRTGMEASAGAHLFLVDSDRQIPLDGFPDAWRVAADVDAVFGIRRNRDDPKIRLLITSLIRVVARVVFGVWAQDANVPFKLVRRTVWEAARPHIPPETLAPSLFLTLFALRGRYRVAWVDVPHRRRASGLPSIRRWRLLRFSLRGLGQLLAFRARIGNV